MKQISYSRHRFPSSIIQHAVWLYFRFPLNFRDVEDMLAERDIVREKFLILEVVMEPLGSIRKNIGKSMAI